MPRIRAHYSAVAFTHDAAAARQAAGETELGELIERNLDNAARGRAEGDSFGVILLTGPDDPDTIRLNGPIMNDVKAASGRAWAWTLGQRYTRLERLRGPTRTSEL